MGHAARSPASSCCEFGSFVGVVIKAQNMVFKSTVAACWMTCGQPNPLRPAGMHGSPGVGRVMEWHRQNLRQQLLPQSLSGSLVAAERFNLENH